MGVLLPRCRSQLTQSRHRPDRNPAAQQSPAVPEVCYPFGRKHGRHQAVKRREFITLLGGTAAAWPLAARTQQTDRVRRVGVLSNFAESDPEAQSMVDALHQTLQELGWV